MLDFIKSGGDDQIEFDTFKYKSKSNSSEKVNINKQKKETQKSKTGDDNKDEQKDEKKGKYIDDNKKLLGDYVSEEELWACTSCNACVEECPISINPLSIIMDMRRNLVMEDSSVPSELNNMMSNIENNGAPWPYNQQDRLNWNE